MPSKGIAYQPRATPWERRFMSAIRSEGTAHNRFRADDTGCGVPSEREMMGLYPIPRALPWAGMRNPVGFQHATCGPDSFNSYHKLTLHRLNSKCLALFVQQKQCFTSFKHINGSLKK